MPTLVNRDWRWSWGSVAALFAAVGICSRGSSSHPTPTAPPVRPPSLPQESLVGAIMENALARRSLSPKKQEQSSVLVQYLCESFTELLSPKTKKGMFSEVEELTHKKCFSCLKLLWYSFCKVASAVVLGKVRLVLHGENTCRIFTMGLSGTKGMNRVNELLTDHLHKPWTNWLRGWFSKLRPFYCRDQPGWLCYGERYRSFCWRVLWSTGHWN